MADVETPGYPLGSAAASIVGIATGLLEREDLDEDLVTRLRAIRDIALELAREKQDEENPTRQSQRSVRKSDAMGRGRRQASRVMKRAEQPPTWLPHLAAASRSTGPAFGRSCIISNTVRLDAARGAMASSRSLRDLRGSEDVHLCWAIGRCVRIQAPGSEDAERPGA